MKEVERHATTNIFSYEIQIVTKSFVKALEKL